MIRCNEVKGLLFFIACVVSGIFYAPTTDAATLRLSPDTGVYTAGKTFSVSVVLNTAGETVNAADAQLSFNPKELQVISVTRPGSVFGLWTEEPSFSNSKGTILFGGGSPSGYKGSSGSIIIITFKALGAGTPKVTFASGSTLAADGLGTNVLTAMNGGVYTIAAESVSPAPEYIPPANTPKAPVVTSSTHPDESVWYKERNTNLTWKVPEDVLAVRVILDNNPGSVPTKVYEEPITEKQIDDLPEGTSYFHIQFKNSDGWGSIKHFKISIDTEAPKNFTVSEDESAMVNNPNRTLKFSAEDVSPIRLYRIQIDGKDPFDFNDTELRGEYTLEKLSPGYHTVTVEAFDSAGNASVASYSLTTVAFEKPVFTDYPTRINTEVIPALKGKTRPNSTVTVFVGKAGEQSVTAHDVVDSSKSYSVMSNEGGEFLFVPDGTFTQGVYVIRATAEDSFGNMSEYSDEIRLIVEVPKYVAVGSIVVSFLSVIVPTISLVMVLLFGTWYLWNRLARWKRRVFKETAEAEERLALEFDNLIQSLHTHVLKLKETRKGKLTKAETELIEQIETDLGSARKRIAKEIEDIERTAR